MIVRVDDNPQSIYHGNFWLDWDTRRNILSHSKARGLCTPQTRYLNCLGEKLLVEARGVEPLSESAESEEPTCVFDSSRGH